MLSVYRCNLNLNPNLPQSCCYDVLDGSEMTLIKLSRDYGFTSSSAEASLLRLATQGGETDDDHGRDENISIDLSGVVLTRKSLLLLASCLSSNRPCIKCLNLNCTSIGNDGARAIALALRTNTNLCQLCISGCHISKDGMVELAKTVCSGGAPMLQHIECDKFTLHENSLIQKKRRKRNSRRRGRNILFEEDCALIAGSVMGCHSHTSCTEFCLLQGEVLKGIGCSAIARSLTRLHKPVQCLKTLVLRDCYIGDEGAMALAKGLAGYTPLELLDIRGDTQIGMKGAAELAQALASEVAAPFRLLWKKIDSFQIDAPMEPE